MLRDIYIYAYKKASLPYGLKGGNINNGMFGVSVRPSDEDIKTLSGLSQSDYGKARDALAKSDLRKRLEENLRMQMAMRTVPYSGGTPWGDTYYDYDSVGLGGGLAEIGGGLLAAKLMHNHYKDKAEDVTQYDPAYQRQLADLRSMGDKAIPPKDMSKYQALIDKAVEKLRKQQK